MSWHQEQQTPSAAYTKWRIHHVQHKPSAAYTAYSIHRVQHLPKIVCLPFVLMITSWPLNVTLVSGVPPYTIHRHQTSLPWELKRKVTLSQSHGGDLNNWWKDSQHPARHPLTSSKSSSKLAWLLPPCAFPNSLDYGLQTCWIAASRCISPKSVEHCLQVYHQTRSITSSKSIYNLTWSLPWSVSLSSLTRHFQAELKLLSSTACNYSPDIPCVDGELYRYIDTEMRIQTEFMSSKNRWTISSNYDFPAHQQCSQR